MAAAAKSRVSATRGSERLKGHVRAAAGGVAIWHIFRRLRPRRCSGPTLDPTVSLTILITRLLKTALRNRASPDLDWDLDEQCGPASGLTRDRHLSPERFDTIDETGESGSIG
jgi:hypothetical protein